MAVLAGDTEWRGHFPGQDAPTGSPPSLEGAWFLVVVGKSGRFHLAEVKNAKGMPAGHEVDAPRGFSAVGTSPAKALAELRVMLSAWLDAGAQLDVRYEPRRR